MDAVTSPVCLPSCACLPSRIRPSGLPAFVHSYSVLPDQFISTVKIQFRGPVFLKAFSIPWGSFNPSRTIMDIYCHHSCQS